MTTPDPNAGGVVIGIRDIYDKLVDVEKQVYALTPTAQTILDHESRVRTLENQLPEKLEDRLRGVEKLKWAVGPTAVGTLIAIVQSLLQRRG